MNLDESEDKRRLFEYFIVAGLNDECEIPPEELGNNNSSTAQPQHPSSSSSAIDESNQMHYNHDQVAPITDICVIFTSAGETTPPDYERIETTPQGYPANLNHGSLRSPAAFLCYKRGYHKPPLIDLGVLDEGKGEKPMVDAVILDKTPYGLTANISNSSSSLFFTTRRAKPDSPPHQLVITNICVILENKGEHPPHTFYKIPKNLNKSMIGSEVYVCYKKSQLACKRIAYAPAVLDCFPRVQNIDDSLLVRNVPMFFLPMGALIEAWPERCRGTEHHARTVSTCVFTDEAYTKYYGASITFYEPYKKQLTEQQLEKLDLGSTGGDETSNNTAHNQQHLQEGQSNVLASKRDGQNALYYCNKAICIVSRYPFFEPFRRFLYFLLNTTASNTSTRIPIERYISHLMYEVPFPSPTRPRVLVELGSDMIAFESSDDSQTPLTGANFVETLKCLGTENLIYAMLLTLLEQKILVHSLRPWLLTCVSETLCALMFPFSWNLPYIPQCPLPLGGVFHAPLSFMVGIDSRYFDLYEEPPSDVTCFDLDTATVSQSAVRKLYQLSMLPKKPLKRLRVALDTIGTKIGEKQHKKGSGAGASGGSGIDYEQTHARRMQSELAIREAFLRFMCCLMDGYTDFLCPIMDSPWKKGATDVCKLFDWEQFVQSRDKHSMEFYAKFRETTCFNRFIEERSGAIGGADPNDLKGDGANNGNSNNGSDGEASSMEDKSVYFVFFDDCIAKLRAETFNAETAAKDKNGPQAMSPARLLLDADSMMAKRTVVVPAPHVHNGEQYGDGGFIYASFPRHFCDAYFETEHITHALLDRPSSSMQRQAADGRRRAAVTAAGCQHFFFLLRTRQEVRKALTDASLLQQQNAGYWPRSMQFFAYSLWFMQLPALLAVSKNKRKMLLLGIRILSRMEQSGVPFHDQVCYRLLMHLCGVYGRPEMAIIVLKKMLNIGIIPNAITYKVYHKALIQSEWPSELRLSAIAAWRRVQLRLDICARFRSLLPPPNSTTVIAPSEEDCSNIVQEIVPMKIVENAVDEKTDSEQHEQQEPILLMNNQHDDIISNSSSNNYKTTNLLDPLGATATAAATVGNGTPVSRQQQQQQYHHRHQAPPKPPRMWEKQQPLLSSTPTNPSCSSSTTTAATTATNDTPSSNNNNFRSLLMSPSREKFIRDHSASNSASPLLFAKEETEENNNKSAAVEKRRRKSLRLGTSWLKSLANTSLSMLHRSQTHETLDSVSRDESVISDERSASTSSAKIDYLSPMKALASEMTTNFSNRLAKLGLKVRELTGDSQLTMSRGESNETQMFVQLAPDPLPIHYWMRDVLPENDTELRDVWLRHSSQSAAGEGGEEESASEYLDVLVCSTSPCSNCYQLVYDEELTFGWPVDDGNLNAKCPHCQHTFLPSLKVCVRTQNHDEQTQQSNDVVLQPSDGGEIVQSFTVPYISPLVLRRELETLVTNSSDGALVMAWPAMRMTHPIIFWNLFYYCRRLELPTHLLTWVAAAVVIHCVQDMPYLPSTEATTAETVAAEDDDKQQQEEGMLNSLSNNC